jgi:chromosome segregation ATPase
VAASPAVRPAPLAPISDPPPHQLDVLVQPAVALQLPIPRKPCEDAINSLSSQFEQLLTQIQITVNSLRDKISEMSLDVSSLSDSRDRMQAFMSAVERENARLREQNEMAIARVQELESKLAKFDEFISLANRRQQQIEQPSIEVQPTAGEPLYVSDRIGRLESEGARIAGVFQETTGPVSAESAARVNFE